MGDRATRAPQSGELVRAKTLRRALKRGAPPAFIPPALANPTALPSSLSWYFPENAPVEKKSAEKSSQPKTSEEILDLRRQYLEQLFESSPDALVVLDASFRSEEH